jgi:hypothetical protein
MSRLESRYRRLLRAYPQGRRRTELLNTLMEAAPPGRSRPTARETVNLLRHGLRARLGRPASRGVVVLAVMLALTTGFGGAWAAARATWQAVPGFPSGAARAQIAETVYPGLGATGELDSDGLFYDVAEQSNSVRGVFIHGHNEDYGFSTLTLSPPDGYVAGDYRTWTDAARARLQTDGWTVTANHPTGATEIATGKLDESGREFSATKGGLAMTFQAETQVVGTPAGKFYATAQLVRITPWYVSAAAYLGLLAGALLGWFATGWVSRRTERARGPVRALTRESVVVAMILLFPQALVGITGMVADSIPSSNPDTVSESPFWSLTLTWGFGCGWLGLLLLALAVGVAALAGRPELNPVVEAT